MFVSVSRNSPRFGELLVVGLPLGGGAAREVTVPSAVAWKIDNLRQQVGQKLKACAEEFGQGGHPGSPWRVAGGARSQPGRRRCRAPVEPVRTTGSVTGGRDVARRRSRHPQPARGTGGALSLARATGIGALARSAGEIRCARTSRKVRSIGGIGIRLRLVRIIGIVARLLA